MPEGRSYTATRAATSWRPALPEGEAARLGPEKRCPVIVVRDADEPGELPRTSRSRRTSGRPTTAPTPPR